MVFEVLPDNTTFTVLSFNCWGIPIPYVVKDYKLRMKAITNALFVEGTYDVICLQEVWSLSDFKVFQHEANNKFPYSHYFHSGVFGSGVCIFSKWPIVEVLFHKWQVNGYVHKILHGDWYGGKGLGLCRLNVNGYRVNIFTCHTHAEYSSNAEYIAHQVVQAFDTAQFIRISSEKVDLAILAADLNTEPGDLCYRIISSYANLTDSFEENKLEFSGTFDCSRNSYRDSKTAEDNPHGKRIDYILYKIGNNVSINCLSYNTPLEARVPHQSFSYSDHEAISATFQFANRKNFGDCTGNLGYSRNKEIRDAIGEGHHICEIAVKELEHDIKLIKLRALVILTFISLIFLVIRLWVLSDGVIFLTYILLVLVISGIFLSIFVWKRIERNGILCSLNGMKISLVNNT